MRAWVSRLALLFSLAAPLLGAQASVPEISLNSTSFSDKLTQASVSQSFQDSSGAITSTVSDGPGSGGNRLQESEATALFIEDTIRLGRFSIIPGLRYERIDYHYIDFENNGDNIPTGDASRTLDIFAPGIGFSYQSDESSNLFAGIYRGFSVPGPRSASRPGRQLDEETRPRGPAAWVSPWAQRQYRMQAAGIRSSRGCPGRRRTCNTLPP